MRRVVDLAYREPLEAKLADDPLVDEQAATAFSYVPTVTREPFHTTGRIDTLIDDGTLFKDMPGEKRLDPETDRIMLCGSMAMIKDLAAKLETLGFVEGSNSHPGQYVIERAFVG